DGRVLVGHLLEVIDDAEVHVAWQEVFTDPFGDVGVDLVLVEDAGLLVLLEHGAVGVDPPHLDARVLLLQVAADAADGAAGADAAHEVRDRAVGLLPDLRARLLVVRGRVRQVVVLVGLPRVRDLALEPRRDRVVRAWILRIDVGRADDHFRAERLQRVHLFLRLLVGRREDALVALDDGGDGEPHARVARGALDDGAARLQLARPLGVLDHPHGHPVLDRIAGIEGLELDEDVGGDVAAGDVVDAHHRRVADGVENGVADLQVVQRRHDRILADTECRRGSPRADGHDRSVERPPLQGRERCLASAATATINSAGSTGFARCIWKPAWRTCIRSSTRAYAVNAAAGTSQMAGSPDARTRRINSNPSLPIMPMSASSTSGRTAVNASFFFTDTATTE